MENLIRRSKCKVLHRESNPPEPGARDHRVWRRFASCTRFPLVFARGVPLANAFTQSVASGCFVKGVRCLRRSYERQRPLSKTSRGLLLTTHQRQHIGEA